MDAEVTSYFESRRRGSTHSNKSRLSIRSCSNVSRSGKRSLKKKGENHGKWKKTRKRSVIKEKNDWADDVIAMFTAPTRKIHIHDDQGLVSNEESLERIISLLLLTSSLLLMLATTFLVRMDFSQKPGLALNGNPRKARVPHVLVIYQDGFHLDFSTDESISPSKTFDIKLRYSLPSYQPCGFNHEQPAKSTGYLAYANDEKIYIFYTDGKKDLTYIDIATGIHRTLSNTAYGTKIMFGSSVRVGDKFFMAGDKLQKCHPFHNWKTKCFIWMEKREKMQQKKAFPMSRYDNSCFASYNRTHFIQAGKSTNDSMVTLVELNSLEQMPIAFMPLFIPYYGYNDHRKTCSIIFNKNQTKSLIVLVKHHIQKGVVLHTLGLETMIWSRAATNLEHFGSLVVAKGMWYYFNILNTDGNLGSYFDSRKNTWEPISQTSFGSNDNVTHDHEQPIVTVPYLG